MNLPDEFFDELLEIIKAYMEEPEDVESLAFLLYDLFEREDIPPGGMIKDLVKEYS